MLGLKMLAGMVGMEENDLGDGVKNVQVMISQFIDLQRRQTIAAENAAADLAAIRSHLCGDSEKGVMVLPPIEAEPVKEAGDDDNGS